MKFKRNTEDKQTILRQAFQIEGLEAELRLVKAERDRLARLLADYQTTATIGGPIRVPDHLIERARQAKEKAQLKLADYQPISY